LLNFNLLKPAGYVMHQQVYLLTPWSRVLLEKLTDLQLVKKFPAFMEPEGSSPHSQTHATRPYPEIAPFSLYTHIPLPEDPSKYYPPIYAWVSPVVSFPQFSPPKHCTHFSSPPFALHAPPISFFLILSLAQYWVRSTDAPTGLTFNNCTLCPHYIYVFCIYLRTNSDLCHLQHKLIGFYNRDEKCLQCGTDLVFK
jgi:hypothetical protein